MLRFLYFPALVCLTLLATANLNAQLTVDTDLGTLVDGTSMNLTGDTATGTNQVDYHSNTNPGLNWGNDTIFQFTVTETVTFNVSSNAVTNDPDFILLNGLSIVNDGVGKTFAGDAIGAFFLDAGPPEAGVPVTIPAGTYYLLASSFWGADGLVNPVDSTYDITLDVAAFVVPPAPPVIADLGEIADADVAFTIDTFGTTVVADTELAVWDEASATLIIINDDAGGAFLSELDLFVGLPAGDYILGVGGFNTVFGDGFTAASTSGEAGAYTLNFNGQTTSGSLVPGNVDFYGFSVGGGGGVPVFPLGDVNQSGDVSFFDIAPFIAVLSANAFQFEADIDGDGDVDFFDIQPFIDILANQ